MANNVTNLSLQLITPTDNASTPMQLISGADMEMNWTHCHPFGAPMHPTLAHPQQDVAKYLIVSNNTVFYAKSGRFNLDS